MRMRRIIILNMKTQSTFETVLIVVVIVLALGFGLYTGREEADEKFGKCLDLAQKYIPDPNETEERSKFIRECYETPNEESKVEIKKAE